MARKKLITVISRMAMRLAAAAAVAWAMSLSSPQSSFALDYPTKPVRLIVGVAPGGANDTVARLVAQALSERLGQPVVVENRPGAGGNIGLEAVANAAPDGYTLLFATSANALAASFYANANVDFARDIAPVTSLVRGPLVMEVNPSFPAKTIPEFIAYAKANPGKVRYASVGIGSNNHYDMEAFARWAGLVLVHLPNKGGGAAITNDLVTGDAHVALLNAASSMGVVKAGQVRALAVMSEARTRVRRCADPHGTRLSQR